MGDHILEKRLSAWAQHFTTGFVFFLIGTRWTYADPSWARIAALVPEVVSCAEAGDEIANEILNHAVAELALTVKAVVQRLGLSGQGAALYKSYKLFVFIEKHQSYTSYNLFF